MMLMGTALTAEVLDSLSAWQSMEPRVEHIGAGQCVVRLGLLVWQTPQGHVFLQARSWESEQGRTRAPG